MKVWAVVVLALSALRPAWAVDLAPAAALAELRRSGVLVDARVTGDLDLSALRPAAGVDELLLDGVTVQGRLVTRRRGPAVGLRLRGGSVGAIDASDSTWPAPLALVGVAVAQYAKLDGARFEAAFAWHDVRVRGPASFVQARFDGAAEFTQCRFEPSGVMSSPRWREAQFHGPARFDRSLSSHDMVFDSARFDTDASFVELSVPGLASWRNVVFGGDAEFRLAKVGRAEFGDVKHLSAFQKLADLRRARFGALVLDYTDLRGELLMSGTVVDGDLTLRHAALRGPAADLRALKVGGVLDFDGTTFDHLRLHWSELGPAIARAAPAVETWAAIESALASQGRAHEALTVSALRARRTFDDALKVAGPAQRALLWTEELLWGRLTGYGTRLDRALGALLAVVLLLALPVFVGPRPAFADGGAGARWRLVLHAAFGRPKCDAEPVPPAPRWWPAWRWSARVLGLGALALVTLTLARVSPALQGLLKAVFG